MADVDVIDAAPPETVPPRRRRRWVVILVGVLAVFVLAAGVGAVWVARQVNPPGRPGAEIDVVIPPGSSTTRIAHILEKRGVITNAFVFRVYVKVQGAGPFRAGTYSIRRHESMGGVVKVLEAGEKLTLDRVTIPEGFTLEQIATQVGALPGRSAARFLELARSGTVRSALQPAGSTSLEGLLFPDTYFVSKQDDELALLRRMVGAFDQVAADLGVDALARADNITPYQAVIVASLVEREARVPDDRGKVARVIFNRLNKPMLLQIDATIQYALGKQKARLTFADLKIDSPYNTYLHAGLPPTPIASPGRASLRATLQPDAGPWLYYVLIDVDGHHAFATTAAEFDRYRREAQAKGLL
jgi:UPF0755 protein